MCIFRGTVKHGSTVSGGYLQGQELSGVERDQRKRYGTGPGDSGFELSACWQLH